MPLPRDSAVDLAVLRMNATTWIALGALAIALWARIDGVFERKARKRQASALSRQLSREGIAYLGAHQQSVTEAEDTDVYVFTITNAGPAVARNIVARIVEWDDELSLDTDVVTEHVKAAMPRGGEVTVKLEVPIRLRSKDLTLCGDWTDDRERHEREELLHLRPPREPDEIQVW